jgi:D-alanyl-D-alanine carboxypeptidase
MIITSEQPSASSEAGNNTVDLHAQLQKILQSAIDVGVPGLSAAIGTSNGIVWKSTAGYADIENAVPIDDSHIFGVGSITKVFISVVILQLIEEKLLTLKDAVCDHLDDAVYHGIDHAKEATIQALLSHRSGVESWEDDPKWIIDGRGKNITLSRIWGKRDTLDYIRHPTHLTPGTYAYANTNYTLLGLIIEKVTHKSAESEVRRRILEPLGLTSTYLEGFEQEGSGTLPRRYHWATQQFIKVAGICPEFTQLRHCGQDLIDVTGSNLSVSWEAGGMISSPSDVVKFATALRDGKLLSSESLSMLQDWRPIPNGENGLGLFRMESSSTGQGKWIGHTGGVLGFAAAMWWSDEEDCVISVLGNIGSVHAGTVPSQAAAVAFNTGFLEIAKKLAASSLGQ